MIVRELRRLGASVTDAVRLARPYFASNEKWGAYGLLAVTLALNLFSVYLNVLYTYWNKIVYDALQDKNAAAFWSSMFTYRTLKGFPYFVPGFMEIAVVAIVAGVYAFYLSQMLQIRWRRWLTERYVDQWLDRRAHYQISLTARAGTSLDNPDQRISEDIRSFVSSNLALGLSFISNVVTLFSFVGVLWFIAPPLHLGTFVIPGYLVWFAVIYSVLGTLFTQLIGRRLIPLTYQQQQVEADFRFNLVRVRENTEQIALYHGEREEAVGLRDRFAAIYTNWWQIMNRTKALNFFTIGFAQIAIVFPFVVAAPNYFSGVFTLGILMQISAIFGNVQNALSWFINAYQDLVAWRATVQRLDGFERAMTAAHQRADTPTVTTRTDGDALRIADLEVGLPDGARLLYQDRLDIPRGAPLAITGPSGAGKSTFFRVLAGVWPYAAGQMVEPVGTMMFLPQKPYLPLGSLKRAVVYPRHEEDFADGTVREALEAVGLPALAANLPAVDNWPLRLSGGEQQRLALARALLAKPDWLFLDEAVSSLEEDAAAALYAVLADRLPETQIVTITHQPAVEALHPRHAVLAEHDGTREFALVDRREAPATAG